MFHKRKIAKFLIVFGFLLNMMNYTVGLIDFYSCEDKTAVVLEETENSEKKEKENTENEDHKEKDKISQFLYENTASVVHTIDSFYPDFYLTNSSVYLEFKTPPPKFS